MTEFNMQDIMNRIQQSFQPERAAGVDANIQFHITGDQGGDWFATIKDKQLTINQGTVPSPKLSVTANAQDLLGMFTGKINPMQAYMGGKIQARGDLGLGMRLAEMFKA